MYYGKTFFNKELAEMVFEYLQGIFGHKAKMEHTNGQYAITINDPDLTHLTDLQKEMVKFFMPHMFK